jgi:hypothetical protein
MSANNATFQSAPQLHKNVWQLIVVECHGAEFNQLHQVFNQGVNIQLGSTRVQPGFNKSPPQQLYFRALYCLGWVGAVHYTWGKAQAHTGPRHYSTGFELLRWLVWKSHEF